MLRCISGAFQEECLAVCWMEVDKFFRSICIYISQEMTPLPAELFLLRSMMQLQHTKGRVKNRKRVFGGTEQEKEKKKGNTLWKEVNERRGTKSAEIQFMIPARRYTTRNVCCWNRKIDGWTSAKIPPQQTWTGEVTDERSTGETPWFGRYLYHRLESTGTENGWHWKTNRPDCGVFGFEGIPWSSDIWKISRLLQTWSVRL